MFQTKVVEKIKTHVMFNNLFFFFQKSCNLLDNVEKYGRARQVTDDNTIQHMRLACWITKTTNTLRICNNSCFSHGNSGYMNAPLFEVNMYSACLVVFRAGE